MFVFDSVLCFFFLHLYDFHGCPIVTRSGLKYYTSYSIQRTKFDCHLIGPLNNNFNIVQVVICIHSRFNASRAQIPRYMEDAVLCHFGSTKSNFSHSPITCTLQTFVPIRLSSHCIQIIFVHSDTSFLPNECEIRHQQCFCFHSHVTKMTKFRMIQK